MLINIPDEFRTCLQAAIEKAGSQSELARKSGVGQSTINSLLNDKRKKQMQANVYDKLFCFMKAVCPDIQSITQSDYRIQSIAAI